MSVYTSTKLTTDHGSRFLAKPTRIVLHHGATTSLSGLIALMMPGGRTVSAHAAIGGREIVNVVPESRRSYSLGSALFERSILSAECVNSTGAPYWLLSDETHESIARWVADVSRRHKIKPHRDGPPSSWTVIGHREVYTIHRKGYATACPGGMRLDWIAKRAQELLGNGTSLAGSGTPITTKKDYDMFPIVRNEGTFEASVFNAYFHGDSDKERGYYVVTDPDELIDLERVLTQKGAGAAKREPRAVYIRMQATFRIAHANTDCALCREVSPVAAKVDLSPVLEALSGIRATLARIFK